MSHPLGPSWSGDSMSTICIAASTPALGAPACATCVRVNSDPTAFGEVHCSLIRWQSSLTEVHLPGSKVDDVRDALPAPFPRNYVTEGLSDGLK